MPIPDPPSRGEASTVAAAEALFRQVHDQVRWVIKDLSEEAMNWVPGDDMNSIGTLLVHLLRSERETVLALAGKPVERDRDSEFRTRGISGTELLRQLDEADALLDEVLPALTDKDLWIERTLPTLPSTEVRPGYTWLIANYGHAREHLGQILLTKQSYFQETLDRIADS